MFPPISRLAATPIECARQRAIGLCRPTSRSSPVAKPACHCDESRKIISRRSKPEALCRNISHFTLIIKTYIKLKNNINYILVWSRFMELRHYRYFVAVAEELHFGHAAERLNIAQPALSIQIRKLEENIGGALFHRTKRSVALTEAGRLFLEEARDILSRTERAEEKIRRAVKGEFGSLHIGFSSLPAISGLLAAVINAIRLDCPGLDIHVHEQDPFSQMEALEKRQLHFSLTVSTGVTTSDQMVSSVLAEWPINIILPFDHPLAEKPSLQMSELYDEQFIVYRQSENDNGVGVIRQFADFEPNIGESVSSPWMVEPLVACGFGIALLPSVFQNYSSNTKTTFRPISDPKVKMACALVHRSNEYDPAVKMALAAARRGAKSWHQSDA